MDVTWKLSKHTSLHYKRGKKSSNINKRLKPWIGTGSGYVGEIGSEPRSDRGVVHDVMKRRSLHRETPELLRFLLCESAGREPRSRLFRIRIRICFALNGPQVVWFAG